MSSGEPGASNRSRVSDSIVLIHAFYYTVLDSCLIEYFLVCLTYTMRSVVQLMLSACSLLA